MLSSMCFPACCRAERKRETITMMMRRNKHFHNRVLCLRSSQNIYINSVLVPLLRSSSSSSSSFSFFLMSSCFSGALSLATHWISPPDSCHCPLWSAGFGVSLMRSSVCASARMAARSRWRNSWGGGRWESQCSRWAVFNYSIFQTILMTQHLDFLDGQIVVLQPLASAICNNSWL